MTSIHDLRDEIGNIDGQIFDLISKRFEIARRIGAEKRRLGLPIVDKDIESGVIERNVKKCVQIGLDPKLGEDLTELLIDHSIKIQKNAGC